MIDQERMRATVARWLEEKSLDAPWTRALSRLGSRFVTRGLARPLDVPPAMVAISVGGATLGGSGKTRVALACTRALARGGRDVVLLGHGYRARGARARVVSPTDSVADAGDEALACARALASSPETRSARVVVARSRQDAIDLAATLVPRPAFVVVDGALQLAPRRADLALLAVDRDEPWGSGAIVPAGDLRAPASSLLALADRVVEVDASLGTVELAGERRSASDFATFATERRLRIGLFTATARPRRLERALERTGLAPVTTLRLPDHGPMTDAVRLGLGRADVDIWLATEKCATHLADGEITSPIAVLRDELTLDPALVSHMRALTPARSKA